MYSPVHQREFRERTLELTVWDQARVREEESQFLGQVRTLKLLGHLDHLDLLEVFLHWKLQEEVTPPAPGGDGTASEHSGAPEIPQDPANLESLEPPAASEVLGLLIYWSSLISWCCLKFRSSWMPWISESPQAIGTSGSPGAPGSSGSCGGS